jgi:hypothetical protein
MKLNKVLGPSWMEVILGATLSVLLGAVLGAGLLILRPVVIAKQEPKERVAGTIYYIEGSRDATRGRQAMAKRQAFLDGQSITVTEDEINVLVAAALKLTAPQPGGAAKESAVADAGYVSAGAPAVRIRENLLQLGLPLSTPLMNQKVIFQARGNFVRQGNGFVYEPSVIYLGSCPLQRLPIIAGYVRSRIHAEYPMPDDLKAAWANLKDVSIEGSMLRLTMP